MSESRSIIRVFLASPGDLGEERRIAKEAVDEVNATTAKPQGYQIDLYGWEDTISAAGRPQAIINEELKQCELFIGMLWAKWGTPPDNDGSFTSGFEEEFSLASSARNKDGTPEMRMYFKKVEEARTKDPGPELSKVIKFKDVLISDKKILFEEFEDTIDYARKLRLGLADYINKKHKLSSATSHDAEISSEPRAQDAGDSNQIISDAISAVQAQYLQTVVQRLGGTAASEPLSPADIARMRLVAMVQNSVGNDEPEMGAHDTNLIYRNRKQFQFERSEIHQLAIFGLEAFNYQNKPLWTWLAATLSLNKDWFLFQTWSDRSAVRKSAFTIARLANLDVLNTQILERGVIIRHWLEQEDDTAQKDALSYLQTVGNDQDLNIIREKLADAPGSTSKDFLETALAITSRYNAVEATELLIGTPFDTLSDELLHEVLKGVPHLKDADLANAIEHRNGDVRAKALLEMLQRGIAPADLGRRFADDDNLAVREAALAIIEKYEGDLALSDIEKILIKPKSQGLGSLIGFGGSYDLQGAKAFDRQKTRRMATKKTSYLKEVFEAGEPDRDFAYFAMCKKNFLHMSSDLRKNFDDRFLAFFQREVETLEARFRGASQAKDLIDKIKAGEEYTRRKYMGCALVALVSASEIQDLSRIRLAIDDSSIDIIGSLFRYLAKHGDWSDLGRISVMAEKRGDQSKAVLFVGGTFAEEGAATIYSIARKRLPELLSFNLPNDLLEKVLRRASASEIASFSDDQIAGLLISDNDAVRKITALKVVSSIAQRRAKRIFDIHIKGERYFYNVVYWLDLLIAFPHSKAKAIAISALNR